MIKYLFGIVIVVLMIVVSCNKVDDTPPIIFLIGEDTLFHILNQPYVDDGATATDETDGNITNNIFTDNQVDVNKTGWHSVTYTVIDEAGNEASPVIRAVRVYNQAYIYEDLYQLTEVQQFPDQNTCAYDIIIRIDSTVNYRIVFENFACGFGQPVYADVSDGYLLVPFQIIEDSLSSLVIQGSGSINDSTMQLDYTLKNDSINTLWEAELIRYQ